MQPEQQRQLQWKRPEQLQPEQQQCQRKLPEQLHQQQEQPERQLQRKRPEQLQPELRFQPVPEQQLLLFCRKQQGSGPAGKRSTVIFS
jgi:hypothetical protein